jgi:replicative DNA helicase
MSMMPCNTELESRVLYGAIGSIDVAELVMEAVGEKHFYQPKNKTLFKAMRTVYERTQRCDVASVTIELERMGELQNYDGEIGIIDNTYDATTYVTANDHIQQLHEYKIRRQLIDDAQDIIANALDPAKDAFAIADYAHERAIDLTTQGGANNTKTIDELISEYESMEYKPFNLIDQELAERIYSDGGCQPGHIEVTIAESGHGKTRYAMYKTAQLAINGYRTHWFQMEDFGGKTAVLFKRMCGEAAKNIVITNKIHDIDDIKREARRVKRDFDTQNIVIDYVQEVTTKSRSRAEEVEQITRQLTRLAMDLSVMMHLTSQMTITDTQRKKWKLSPRPNDVRWSKQLKQAAHVVTGVFRPSQIDDLRIDDNYVEDWKGGQLPRQIVVVQSVKGRDSEDSHKPVLLYDTRDGMVNYRIWQKATESANNAWRTQSAPKLHTPSETNAPF